MYVGKVEQVYRSHNYVLIALAGKIYEPGTVLISQSPGLEENRRVANLVVTEERLGRARIPADIRSGAVEAGDLVFLYRNLAAPESSGKKDDQDPDHPAPKPDEDNRDITPPITPDSGKTPDGLLPMPGEEPAPDSAEQERISREREKSCGSWTTSRAGWMTRGARLFPENRQENDFLDSFNKSLFFGKSLLG